MAVRNCETLNRLSRNEFALEKRMSLDELIERTPAYAKDLKLNYSTLVRQQTELTAQQLWGTVVASAIASRNQELTSAALADAAASLSPQALEAAKSAAAIMGMNNVYYRFTHLTKNEEYATLPARLRMNAIRTHGIEQVDFELWCTAVSAINGCGACVDSHEQVVRQKGLSEEQIVTAIRVASVIHALACVFDAERVQESGSAAAAD
jgi:lipoyl-dependent peroxiredoxin subunit D